MFTSAARTLQVHQQSLMDLASLVMRVAFGGMMLVGHGWGKLTSFTESRESFPDPLGIGSTASMAGAIFGEVICAGLIILGLATRLASAQLVFTFLVAAFIIHKNDPLFLGGGAAKEPALLYLIAFASIMLLGPGRISIDHALFGRTKPAV